MHTRRLISLIGILQSADQQLPAQCTKNLQYTGCIKQKKYATTWEECSICDIKFSWQDEKEKLFFTIDWQAGFLKAVLMLLTHFWSGKFELIIIV